MEEVLPCLFISFSTHTSKGRTVHTLDPPGQLHVNPAALSVPHSFDCYGQYTQYTPKSDHSPTYPYPYYFTQMPHQDTTPMGQGDQAADYHSPSIYYYPIFPVQPSYPTLNFHHRMSSLNRFTVPLNCYFDSSSTR